MTIYSWPGVRAREPIAQRVHRLDIQRSDAAEQLFYPLGNIVAIFLGNFIYKQK